MPMETRCGNPECRYRSCQIMRRIPVTLDNNHEKVIGFLRLDCTVSDEMLKNMSISWHIHTEKNKILGMALIPQLAVPKVKIENVSPNVLGPNWNCALCKEEYTSYDAKWNCCPNHAGVVCTKCMQKLHPKDFINDQTR